MEVVLVTAGNGFVGQHFLKHLQSHGPKSLREIRVLDEKPFHKLLDYEPRVPVKSFVGTVFDSAVLDGALDGVDTVVHLYELKDTSMLPDRRAMERVNCQGTKLLTDACREHPSIVRFLLLSSSDVNLNNEVACDANVCENGAVPEGNWAYPDYCSTKYQAEKIVFACDGFQSMSARLGPVYGELDDQEWGFGTQLRLGKRFDGAVPVLGDRQGTMMLTYIGNAAYGMIRMLDKMLAEPACTREPVFLLDDTPLIDFHSILEPMADARGYTLRTLPIWFMFFFLPYWIVEKLARSTERLYCFGLKPFLKKLPAARVLFNYFYTYTTFSSFKSLMYVGYKPLYTHGEALERSIKYYGSDQL